MRALFLAACLVLGGCAAGLSSTPAPSSRQLVYTAESDFAAALTIAVAYENLPACSATQKFPCSDPSAVTKVTAAAKVARASLATAEAAVRSTSNASALSTAALRAQSDVAVFRALAAAVGA